MSLAMAIHNRFDVKIGVEQSVGRQRSLRELSSMIDSMQQGKSIDEPAPLDLEREVDVLSSKIDYCRSAVSGQSSSPVRRVSLTLRFFVTLWRSVHLERLSC